MIKSYKASSLGEFYNAISSLGEHIAKYRGLGDRQELPLIWFRAEESVNYSLLPSLYRVSTTKGMLEREGKLAVNEQYSYLHYAEDIRIQHYHAKNYHYLEKQPTSRIEYLEIMQHHSVKTRLLDWSESSTHSLLFALEPFYSMKADNFERRYDISPCIWILDPQGLNIDLFQNLLKNKKLMKSLLNELNLSVSELNDLVCRISALFERDMLESYYISNGNQHIDHVLNLSEIENELYRNRSRLKKRYLLSESMNPLYYLLSRIYSDGYKLDDYILPPLAVVQPYHSQRIRAQRGVFTVFPFYNECHSSYNVHNLKANGINPASMLYNNIARKHLYKIVLVKPQKIAKEIIYNGMNESWLYPEMPYISNEIEHHNIY